MRETCRTSLSFFLLIRFDSSTQRMCETFVKKESPLQLSNLLAPPQNPYPPVSFERSESNYFASYLHSFETLLFRLFKALFYRTLFTRVDQRGSVIKRQCREWAGYCLAGYRANIFRKVY